MPRPAATLQQSVSLVPFEAGLTGEWDINASFSWCSSGQLDLSFAVLAEKGLAGVVLPKGLIDGAQTQGVRRDELWRSTCFEAFLGLPGETRRGCARSGASAWRAAAPADPRRPQDQQRDDR